MKLSKPFSSILGSQIRRTNKSLRSIIHDINGTSSDLSGSEQLRMAKRIRKLNVDPRDPTVTRAMKKTVIEKLGDSGQLAHKYQGHVGSAIAKMKNEALLGELESLEEGEEDMLSKSEQRRNAFEEKKRMMNLNRQRLRAQEEEKKAVRSSGLIELQSSAVSMEESSKIKDQERKKAEKDTKHGAIDMMID